MKFYSGYRLEGISKLYLAGISKLFLVGILKLSLVGILKLCLVGISKQCLVGILKLCLVGISKLCLVRILKLCQDSNKKCTAHRRKFLESSQNAHCTLLQPLLILFKIIMRHPLHGCVP